MLFIHDVVPIADEKLNVFKVSDDIYFFLIPGKFIGYNAGNVYNCVSFKINVVFKLNPRTLPIEYVLSV